MTKCAPLMRENWRRCLYVKQGCEKASTKTGIVCPISPRPMRLMTGKRAGTLLELMHPIEYFTLARAWEDLTDDEFFWEPFTTTWSIRRQDQCTTPNPFGAGEWVADFGIPEPAPVPVTTIAWLYWHIGSMPGRLCDTDLLGGTRTMASGWTSPYLTHHPIFTSAAEAVNQLRDRLQRL